MEIYVNKIGHQGGMEFIFFLARLYSNFTPYYHSPSWGVHEYQWLLQQPNKNNNRERQ